MHRWPEEKVMNALERASTLMQNRMCDVPPNAVKYVQHLSDKYGGCGEVFVTGFAHYAELCEGYDPSPDTSYVADAEARAFFGKLMLTLQLQVRVYSEVGEPDWHGSVVEVSRVPCVGESIRLSPDVCRTVIRVTHQTESENRVVAGLVLAINY
jgi:hypothetical protein